MIVTVTKKQIFLIEFLLSIFSLKHTRINAKRSEKTIAQVEHGCLTVCYSS